METHSARLLCERGVEPSDRGVAFAHDRRLQRRALRRALLETRRDGTQVRSARQLWQDFAAELADLPGDRSALQQAMERALDWEEVARGDAADFDLNQATADLQAVNAAIGQLIEAIHGEEEA